MLSWWGVCPSVPHLGYATGNCNTFIRVPIKKCCNSVTIETIKILQVALNREIRKESNDTKFV